MRLWAFIVFFLVSCATPVQFLKNSKGLQRRICEDPVFYVIDDKVPERFYDDIHKGMTYWNNQLDHSIFIYGNVQKDPESSSHILVIKSEKLDKNKCAIAVIKSWEDGCCLEMDIILSTQCFRRTNPEMETLIRHEAGHILGLNNSSNQRHLMYESVLMNLSHPVDAREEELEAVREIYGKEEKSNR